MTFTLFPGFVAQIVCRAFFPLPQTDLAYGVSDRYAKRSIAIENGNTDLDLGDLPVEVPCHERLAHQFQAVHLGFDAASSVISAPASPHSAAQISLCAERVVPSHGSGARRFPGFGILRVGITAWAFLAAMAS